MQESLTKIEKEKKRKEDKEEIYCIFCSYDGQGILPPPSSLKLDYLFYL
jgi:hypothetical protein